MQLNLLEIYNKLLAGEDIIIEFTSAEEAESFRITMHQFKAKQEKVMLSLDMPFESATFHFRPVQAEPKQFLKWLAYFSAQRKQKTYKIVTN